MLLASLRLGSDYWEQLSGDALEGPNLTELSVTCHYKLLSKNILHPQRGAPAWYRHSGKTTLSGNCGFSNSWHDKIKNKNTTSEQIQMKTLLGHISDLSLVGEPNLNSVSPQDPQCPPCALDGAEHLTLREAIHVDKCFPLYVHSLNNERNIFLYISLIAQTQQTHLNSKCSQNTNLSVGVWGVSGKIFYNEKWQVVFFISCSSGTKKSFLDSEGEHAVNY